jgi:hypothetical protein
MFFTPESFEISKAAFAVNRTKPLVQTLPYKVIICLEKEYI